MLKKLLAAVTALSLGFGSMGVLGAGVDIDSKKSERDVYVHANDTQEGNVTTVFMGDDAKVYLAVDNPNKGDYDETVGADDIDKHLEPQYDLNGYIVKFYYDPEFFDLIDTGPLPRLVFRYAPYGACELKLSTAVAICSPSI